MRAQAGRARASASAHGEVGRLEAELDEATRELEAVTAELEASTATLAEREVAHAAEAARLQGALEEAGARAERQRARADGLAADKAGLERALGEAAAAHAARAAGLQGALGAAREELEAARGLGERLRRWEEHVRGGHGALEGRAAALAQALEQVGEALKIERYVDLGEKAEILVYASQILHSLGQLEADAAQLAEKDRALAALEERAADADLLEAEVERLAGFEERYEILRAVNADLTDLGAEELAARARDAEVQLQTLLRENAHLQEAAGELADQLRRSQALAELTVAGKAAAERELEAKVRSTKETLVANELLRLENLALKAPDLQAPPPFPVRLEKGRVQISGSAFSDVPSAGLATTVEVQATGLVFALAAEPAEVMWTEIHGWAVENDKLALHFIDSGVLDKASVLLTFDGPAPGPGPEAAGDPRRSLADLVGLVLRNCQRAAVEKAEALRMAPEFTCVTSLDKSDLRLWYPAEGADGVEPMLEQIKSIGEELAAVHTRLLAKLADPLPPEAGGGDSKVGKLEEAFVLSQATAAVLKHRFAALRTQCAAAIKQAYNGLLLARAADDGGAGRDRDPAPGPQAGALEALFKEFAFRTEPLSADMDQLPKLALKNVEKIWRRRVEASERALQELRDANEALEDRLAGFAQLEAELQRREAHLQDKVEATVTANSMLEVGAAGAGAAGRKEDEEGAADGGKKRIRGPERAAVCLLGARASPPARGRGRGRLTPPPRVVSRPGPHQAPGGRGGPDEAARGGAVLRRAGPAEAEHAAAAGERPAHGGPAGLGAGRGVQGGHGAGGRRRHPPPRPDEAARRREAGAGLGGARHRRHAADRAVPAGRAPRPPEGPRRHRAVRRVPGGGGGVRPGVRGHRRAPRRERAAGDPRGGPGVRGGPPRAGPGRAREPAVGRGGEREREGGPGGSGRGRRGRRGTDGLTATRPPALFLPLSLAVSCAAQIFCTEPASLYWVGVFELFVWLEGHPRLKSGLHLALAERLHAAEGGAEGAGAPGPAEGGPGGTPAPPSPLAELALSPKEAAFAKELESLLTHAEADRGALRRENDALQQQVQSLQVSRRRQLAAGPLGVHRAPPGARPVGVLTQAPFPLRPPAPSAFASPPPRLAVHGGGRRVRLPELPPEPGRPALRPPRPAAPRDGGRPPQGRAAPGRGAAGDHAALRRARGPGRRRAAQRARPAVLRGRPGPGPGPAADRGRRPEAPAHLPGGGGQGPRAAGGGGGPGRRRKRRAPAAGGGGGRQRGLPELRRRHHARPERPHALQGPLGGERPHGGHPGAARRVLMSSEAPPRPPRPHGVRSSAAPASPGSSSGSSSASCRPCRRAPFMS